MTKSNKQKRGLKIMTQNENNNHGITLIVLVITIIVLLILAGITIMMLMGENGVLNQSKTAKEKNLQKEAEEIMNLKITNIQIESYTEKQEMPNIQYLADKLCDDMDMDYVELTTQIKKQASKEKTYLPLIEVEEGGSIFTKLQQYPYEFEIDSELKLASIDGIQIGDNSNQKEIEDLKAMMEDMQKTIHDLQAEVQQVKQEKINYAVNQEKKIGKWYDGTDMYELCLPITIPNASKEGDLQAKNTINLQEYNIKECNVVEGFAVLTNNYIAPLPVWLSYDESAIGLRVYYYSNTKSLEIVNSKTNYNAGKGYVTLHYNKNS